MFFRLIYDDALAQAAYLIGCQQTGEAIVIDPERDVDRYLDLAQREGLRIVAAAETHIHADFLSGVRELAVNHGATAYVSAEGGDDWRSRWLGPSRDQPAPPHHLLRDGDEFLVGHIHFRVIHTPGHTPEHICYLVTDRGGGADEPIGLLSGDFVFTGDLGRPDLLETAAGHAGAMKPAAKQLHASLKKFLALPDHVQVWPGHGAGSACGKALGAVPQSTVGYEKRFNPAIRAATGESAFVDYILADQPEPPLYFARMKRDNRDGPAILGALPDPPRVNAADVARAANTAIIDARPWSEFREAHLPGALRIPLDNSFCTVAGSFIDEGSPIVLVMDDRLVDDAVRRLVRIGLDNIAGRARPADVRAFIESGGAAETTDEITVEAADDRRRAGNAVILDVRNGAEFRDGHIPGARNIPYTRLAAQLDSLPTDANYIVNCRSGGRSSRACSLLQKHGYTCANLEGGFSAWQSAGKAIDR